MNENKNNINYLGKKIDNLNNNIMNNFQQLNNNNNDIKINTTINYNDGNYISKIKNGMRNGKGNIYLERWR